MNFQTDFLPPLSVTAHAVVHAYDPPKDEQCNKIAYGTFYRKSSELLLMTDLKNHISETVFSTATVSLKPHKPREYQNRYEILSLTAEYITAIDINDSQCRIMHRRPYKFEK